MPLAAQQERGETRGGLSDKHAVHSVRSRRKFTTKSGSTELKAGVETGMQLGDGVRVVGVGIRDQRVQFGTGLGIRILIAPRACLGNDVVAHGAAAHSAAARVAVAHGD